MHALAGYREKSFANCRFKLSLGWLRPILQELLASRRR